MENKEKKSDFIKQFLESTLDILEEDSNVEKNIKSTEESDEIYEEYPWLNTNNKKQTKDIDKILEEYGLKIYSDNDSLNNYLEDSFTSEDLFIDPLEKLNKKSKYPISEYQAFQIANENQNLKSDYCRSVSKRITYLNFNNCKIKLLTKSKRKYWHIKITEGKVSWIDFDEENTDEFPEPIFCDGYLIKEDFKKLQCLIDVNTGEYIYYSK